MLSQSRRLTILIVAGTLPWLESAQAQDAQAVAPSVQLSVPPPKTRPATVLAPPPAGLPPPPVALPTSPAPPGPVAKLNTGDLYIYSFLDIREEGFSPQVLDQLDQQMTAALVSQGVQSHILRFKASTVGMYFSQSTSTPTYGATHSSDRIPVEQTITSNQVAERMFSVKYRLIEFPSDFQIMGAWRYYKIRWILMNCTTNQIVWQYLYSGRNLILWNNSERAESRAKPLVDTLIAQLKTAGFL
jgi:hypothetical protein